MVMKGATYYATTCAHCHGAPQLGQNPIALSMRPQPQYLPTEARRFSPAELFYIVKHGVKYSAMPAWAAQTRADEVWPVVAFLRAMPNMRYAAFVRLAYGERATGQGAATPAFAPPAKPAPYQLHAADAQTDPTNLYAAPAFGFTDIQAADPGASCAACHGVDGRGREGGRFPNLTLQTNTYLRDALGAFASGQRASAYMQNIATQLTSAQMDSLASRYASMAATPLPVAKVDPQLKAQGARIAGFGAARHRTAECTACHGVTRAIGDAVPRLEGQSFGYIVDQMRAFRAGGRGYAGGKDVMTAISRTMTDHQIIAVAAYYASTPPSPKPVATARAASAP
jgi:cytochrome c553